jgi:hypothetical protein
MLFALTYITSDLLESLKSLLSEDVEKCVRVPNGVRVVCSSVEAAAQFVKLIRYHRIGNFWEVRATELKLLKNNVYLLAVLNTGCIILPSM